MKKLIMIKMKLRYTDNTYPLENSCFATVNPAQPDQLLEEEEQVMERLLALCAAFGKAGETYEVSYEKRQPLFEIQRKLINTRLHSFR